MIVEAACDECGEELFPPDGDVLIRVSERDLCESCYNSRYEGIAQ